MNRAMYAPSIVSRPLQARFLSIPQSPVCYWLRVNIAPLQRAGLLTADVLAGKDADKAIADRAAWRDDERRRCREGKLPKPG